MGGGEPAQSKHQLCDLGQVVASLSLYLFIGKMGSNPSPIFSCCENNRTCHMYSAWDMGGADSSGVCVCFLQPINHVTPPEEETHPPVNLKGPQNKCVMNSRNPEK